VQFVVDIVVHFAWMALVDDEQWLPQADRGGAADLRGRFYVTWPKGSWSRSSSKAQSYMQ